MDSSDAKCKAGSQLLLSVVIALSMTGGLKADSAVFLTRYLQTAFVS